MVDNISKWGRAKAAERYADGGPTAWDFTKAQAADMYETGKHIISGGKTDYTPYRNTQKLVTDAKARASTTRADRQPEGR